MISCVKPFSSLRGGYDEAISRNKSTHNTALPKYFEIAALSLAMTRNSYL